MRRTASLLCMLLACSIICNAENNIFGISSVAVPDPAQHYQYGIFTGIDNVETALYNLAVDDMVCNMEEDGTFRTGKLWGGVWTRDISYSVILSLAHLEPQYVRNSLMRKVDSKGRIIQDTGTGGAWPCSIDREIWIVAAYELYLETGDLDWLRQVYAISTRSINADYTVAYNKETSLFRGESSFIDWRHQSYPEWTDCKDICQSECLGTNAVFVGALKCLSEMAATLGFPKAAADYKTKADDLSDAINRHLWMEDKGYYAQYRYGRIFSTLSPRSETLGEALCILFGVASPKQARSILANMPVSQFGPTVFWPQIADQFSYHNNAIWPFVTSFYALAASKAGSHSGILCAMKSNAEFAAAHGTNYENRVSSDGSTATSKNSPRQLWSIAGYLGVYRRLMLGMDYTPDGIRFCPDIPRELEGTRTLNGLKYRNMMLDISVSGSGSRIQSFVLDGTQTPSCTVPSSLKGRHHVSIVMTEAPDFKDIPVKIRPYVADIATPKAEIKGNCLVWTANERADHYKVVFNGKTVADKVRGTSFPIKKYGEYCVIAVKPDGVESFMSEPVRCYENEITVKSETQLSTNEGIQLKCKMDVPRKDFYAIDWLYSNGNGEIETRNCCATRTMFIDGKCCGAIVMPQRGKNNWEDKGWSNSVKVELQRGQHTIELRYLEDNINMNVRKDSAIVHSIRLTDIK